MLLMYFFFVLIFFIILKYVSSCWAELLSILWQNCSKQYDITYVHKYYPDFNACGYSGCTLTFKPHIYIYIYDR